MDDVTQGGQVDNAGMADDYFSMYEEVDESTGEAVNLEHEESQRQPAQGNQQQQAPQGAQAQQAQSAQQQVPATPQGFAARFYRQGDDGTQQLDAEALHGFVMAQDGPRFAYQRQQAAQQMPNQQPAQGNQQQEDVPIWKRPVVERQKYEQSIRDNMLFPIQRMRESLGQNIDPNTRMFLDQMERLAIDQIRDEIVPKWQYEQEETWRKQQHEEMMKGQKAQEFEREARTNIGALANETKLGMDGLNEFFFGKTSADGKHVPGPATDVLNYFFDRDNPDKVGLTGQALQQAYLSWWNEFASNRANLNMLWDFGLARFQRENWNNIVGKVRATQQQQAQQQRRARVPAASPSNAVAGQGVEPDAGHNALNQYLENVPTI